MAPQQTFGWFLSRGFGPHGWAAPSYEWGYDWRRPDLYQQSAQTLEQAGFDFLLIEDALSVGITESTLDLRVRQAYGGPKHDPWALAPFLFSATQHLGVIPTINPASLHPYTAARLFSSLHQLSGGRLGLNVVTDVGSAHHFGQERLPHDGAYDRAQEWMEALKELWDSWEEGALVEDPASGTFADGSRIRAVRHEGEHYSFEGPLNAAPFFDGGPVVASPGGSPRGLEFAGQHSDIQLALAPLKPELLKAHREKVRAAAEAQGREADSIKVLFVFKPLIVGSAAEADRIVEESLAPSDEALLKAAQGWSSDLETDLTALDLDAPLKPEDFGDHVSQGSLKALKGSFDSPYEVPLREILTAKARLGRVGDGIAGTIGAPTVGTAAEVADLIEQLGEEAGNDGLLFSGDIHPVTIHRTLDELVPELRRRGVLRSDRAGGGLRDQLGLAHYGQARPQA